MTANLRGFASHIHVLYREVPFILNITHIPALLFGFSESYGEYLLPPLAIY